MYSFSLGGQSQLLLMLPLTYWLTLPEEVLSARWALWQLYLNALNRARDKCWTQAWWKVRLMFQGIPLSTSTILNYCLLLTCCMIISSWLFKSQEMFVWQKDKGRGENFLDGGAAFYDTYRTKDGKFMAVGALEPQFFAELSRILSDNGESLDLEQFSGSTRDKLSSAFSTRTQQEWVDIFDGTDACVTPVVCEL